jgi:hypothetical protein
MDILYIKTNMVSVCLCVTECFTFLCVCVSHDVLRFNTMVKPTIVKN